MRMMPRTRGYQVAWNGVRVSIGLSPGWMSGDTIREAQTLAEASMRLAVPVLCFGLLLASCATLEISTDATGLVQKKATKPTGSNFARQTRDPDLEGWRQG